MFELIIFDCDGTLTDSEYVNNRAFLDTLHEDGFTQYDMDYAYRHWVGTTITQTLDNIAAETGRMPANDLVDRYIRRVQAMMPAHLKVIAGAEDLVAACAQRYKICVASNGERRNVVQSLRLTGLLDYFGEEHVFTKIQVQHAKPAPDLFLFAAAQMGVAPEHCLVLEDSRSGVKAGVAAQMTVWGFSGAAHEPATAARHHIDDGAQESFARLDQIAARLM